MYEVASSLTSDNLRMMRYLCSDLVPHGRAFPTPGHLLDYFEQRGLIHSSDMSFLAEILYRVHRHDLLKRLPGVKNRRDYELHFLESDRNLNFSRFRLAAFALARALTSGDDLHTLRNLCKHEMSSYNYERSRGDPIAFLVSLEEEDLFSADDLEFILDILRRLDNQAPCEIINNLRREEEMAENEEIRTFSGLQISSSAAPTTAAAAATSSVTPLRYFVAPPVAAPQFQDPNAKIFEDFNYPQQSRAGFSAYQPHHHHQQQPQAYHQATSFVASHQPEHETSYRREYSDARAEPVPAAEDRSSGGVLWAPQSAKQPEHETNPPPPPEAPTPEYRSEKPVADRSRALRRLESGKLVPKPRVEPYAAADAYAITKNPCGLCVIINNEKFLDRVNYADAQRRLESKHELNRVVPNIGLQDREGSARDVASVRNLFTRLGFRVRLHENLDQRDMTRTLEEYARTDHAGYDCFVCFIMTHGLEGCVYGVDGHSIGVSRISRLFRPDRCPSLVGKPKIFFFQACQGETAMRGVKKPPLSTAATTAEDIEHDAPETLLCDVPLEADFLIAHSTVPGYLAYRSRTEGSWFIDSLVRCLGDFVEREDLLSILIRVNGDMATRELKQMPMPIATLRKKIFLGGRSGSSSSSGGGSGGGAVVQADVDSDDDDDGGGGDDDMGPVKVVAATDFAAC